MQEEIWKPVVGYENYYKISNYGNVYSLRKNKLMSPSLNVHGYKRVHLSCHKKTTTKNVHLLVAYSFLNHTPQGMKLVINHKDHDKTNNYYKNLEIVTQRYNSQHAFFNKKKSSKYTGVYRYKMQSGNIKYTAQIQINGKRKRLGYFFTEEEASSAYKNEILKLSNN